MTQTAFRAALLDPDLAVPDGLTDPHGRPAGRRFDVYRNNVVASLTRVLAAGYPVIAKITGPEFFARMAGVYLRRHPPKTRLMMLYGDDMPQFLNNFLPVAHLPYLPDVARLELARRQSYHAADRAPVSPDQLHALGADALLAARVDLAPSLRLIRSDWPIHTIWHMNTVGAPGPLPAAAETILILRPAFDPLLHPISAEAACFIAALQSGQTIAKASETAGDAFDLGSTLTLLLQNAAITQVT